MSDKKKESLDILQSFLDQSVGCGIFKKAADVLLTQAAIDHLRDYTATVIKGGEPFPKLTDK